MERAAAVAALADHAHRTGEQILAVFDGGGPAREMRGTLEVRWTPPGRSADDEIVAAVRGAKRPREVVVVTADRALGRRVREYRAQVLAPAEFAARIDAAARAGRPPAESGDEKPTDVGDVEAWVRLFEQAPPRDERR